MVATLPASAQSLLKVRAGPALADDVHSKRQPGRKWRSPGWLQRCVQYPFARTDECVHVGSLDFRRTRECVEEPDDTPPRLGVFDTSAATPRLMPSPTPRALQAWLEHKNIQHTERHTELAPDRFDNVRDQNFLVEGRRLEPARYGLNRNTRHHATGAVPFT